MAFSSGNTSTLSALPNVTPLIDILLVLLIIFMIIVPVAPHGLESSIPGLPGPSVPAQEFLPVTIHVIATGLRDMPVRYRLDGQDLEFSDLKRALVRQRSRSVLRIGGDPSLEYRSVVALVAEAKVAGYQNIGLLPRGE